jgi:hypothetical protein
MYPRAVHCHAGSQGGKDDTRDTVERICGGWRVAIRSTAHLITDDPTNLNKQAAVARIGRGSAIRQRTTHRLTLAGLPVDPADETKHFKMIGTTGTGKSTAIRELLDRRARARRSRRHRRPRLQLRRPLLRSQPRRRHLESLRPRAARWDLFAEMTTMLRRRPTRPLADRDTEGTERPWRNYARVFLTSLLRQLHRVKHDDVGELYSF